jgi:transposase
MNQIVVDHGHGGDPHRRWLRHTYQEGPGFLFLATRGGRPPMREAVQSETAEIRLRARVLRVAREGGIAAALALGECSRASLFRWQAAYERGGLEALRPLRRGPRQPVAGYPSWVEQVVIAVRLLTYWNSKRISAELRRRQIADVGETWIEALFDRLGTARPSLPRETGPRYERSHPNELWHIDIKGPFSSSSSSTTTSRHGWSAWSTTTPATYLASAFRPRLSWLRY